MNCVCDSKTYIVSYNFFFLSKDDPSTNAGRGSSLTEDGHVECDASIMDGTSEVFGAVGALSGESLDEMEAFMSSP